MEEELEAEHNLGIDSMFSQIETIEPTSEDILNHEPNADDEYKSKLVELTETLERKKNTVIPKASNTIYPSAFDTKDVSQGFRDSLYEIESDKARDRLTLDSTLQHSQLASEDDSYSIVNGQKIDNRTHIYNNSTPQEMQILISDLYDRDIHSDGRGGNYTLDKKGKRTPSLYLDDELEYLYIGGTKDDSGFLKVGRSALTPEERYTPGMTDGYGWKSGKHGLSLDKTMQIRLPKDVVKNAEKYLQGSIDFINGRAVYKDNDDSVNIDNYIALGGGGTEYSKGWLSSNKSSENLDYDPRHNPRLQDSLRAIGIETNTDGLIIDTVKKTVSNLAHRMGQGVDVIGRLVAEGGENVGWFDEEEANWLRENTKTTKEEFDGALGISSEGRNKEVHASIALDIKNENYAAAAGTVLLNAPKLLIESIPQIVTLAVPSGLVLEVNGMVEEQMSKFNKVNGRDPSTLEYASMWVTNGAVMAVDKLIFLGDIVKASAKMRGKKTPDMIRKTSPLNRTIGATATGIVATGIAEAGQEVVQGFVESYWAKGGSKSWEDFEKKLIEGKIVTSDESIQAAMTGAGVGSFFKGTLAIPGLPKDIMGTVRNQQIIHGIRKAQGGIFTRPALNNDELKTIKNREESSVERTKAESEKLVKDVELIEEELSVFKNSSLNKIIVSVFASSETKEDLDNSSKKGLGILFDSIGKKELDVEQEQSVESIINDTASIDKEFLDAIVEQSDSMDFDEFRDDLLANESTVYDAFINLSKDKREIILNSMEKGKASELMGKLSINLGEDSKASEIAKQVMSSVVLSLDKKEALFEATSNTINEYSKKIKPKKGSDANTHNADTTPVEELNKLTEETTDTLVNKTISILNPLSKNKRNDRAVRDKINNMDDSVLEDIANDNSLGANEHVIAIAKSTMKRRVSARGSFAKKDEYGNDIFDSSEAKGKEDSRGRINSFLKTHKTITKEQHDDIITFARSEEKRGNLTAEQVQISIRNAGRKYTEPIVTKEDTTPTEQPTDTEQEDTTTTEPIEYVEYAKAKVDSTIELINKEGKSIPGKVIDDEDGQFLIEIGMSEHILLEQDTGKPAENTDSDYTLPQKESIEKSKAEDNDKEMIEDIAKIYNAKVISENENSAKILDEIQEVIRVGSSSIESTENISKEDLAKIDEVLKSFIEC